MPRFRGAFVLVQLFFLPCLAFAAEAAPLPNAAWWPEGKAPPFIAAVPVDSEDPRAVLLQGARFLAPSGAKLASPADASLPAALRGDTPTAGGWLIVQFARGVSGDERAQILARHRALPGPLVPNEAQLARVAAADVAALAAEPRVTWIGRLHPAFKLSPALGAPTSGRVASPAVASPAVTMPAVADPWRVDVMLTPDADAESVARALRAQDAVRVMNSAPGRLRLQFDDSAVLTRLARRDDVLFIHETPVPRLFNDQVRWILQSGNPGDDSLHRQGVRGGSQSIAIMDTGVQTSHCCFSAPGKVQSNRAYGDGTLGIDETPSHGTHVAGTAACRNGGDHDGMAPDSPLVLQDIADSWTLGPPYPLTGAWDDARQANANVHSNSWGDYYNGYAGDQVDMDNYTWTHPEFLLVYAAGNDGPAPGTLSSYGNAKNSLTVGATGNGTANNDMADFSSVGPAADGRISPQLTAPGAGVFSALNAATCGWVEDSGTSMATPGVAGAAALVRDYFVSGWYPLGSRHASLGFSPSAALVKATLLVSARDMTGAYSGGHRPNNSQGFGRVTLDDALYFVNDDTSRRLMILDDRNTSTGFTTSGAVDQYTVHLTGNGPFKAMLVWSDPPGGPNRAKQLVNDLDLDVITPDGKQYAGNQGFVNGSTVNESSSHDRLNNMEAVFLDQVVGGDVTVKVTAFAVPGATAARPQDYALVVLAPVVPPCTAAPPTGIGNSMTMFVQGTRIVATWPDVHADHYVAYRGNVPNFYTPGMSPYEDNVSDASGAPGVQWIDQTGLNDGYVVHYYLFNAVNACGVQVP